MKYTLALYYEQDMEPTPTSSPNEIVSKHRTPWGAIIGLVLILSIVVAGAYYSFTKRYQPAPHAAPQAQSY